MAASREGLMPHYSRATGRLSPHVSRAIALVQQRSWEPSRLVGGRGFTSSSPGLAGLWAAACLTRGG